ncbi:Mrr restriction system protein [Clostridium sp. C1]|uniref:restriction endonuclease n=1 Tax=Clostridium sp. C1 TaxID=1155388 RepID=UPI001BAD7FA8|nr:restriction endonuclease [Clostridium sp. C1]QUN14160.1 Mrr restriction system protein [Clostridium sp. C1]
MGVILKNLSSDEKVAYLYKPILIVLQEAGGKLDRSEIKSRISDLDEQIAEFAEVVKTSKSTGNTYKEFNFKFNFAIKELSFVKYLSYTKGNPNITLTDKGLNVDIDSLDVKKEIMIPAKKFWNELSKKNEENKAIENDVDESMSEDRILNDFKESLLQAIANMSPKKFEAFSRALLTKMGVEFTNKGVQISNDGGIDGYGYHRDQDDFRTTRVVIQCKRYNTGPVTEPDINQFLGAMNKFQADYGVFITNSRFTNSARIASREGSPITLIDGNDLVDLVIRYQLYITPVTTYVLDDFYNE